MAPSRCPRYFRSQQVQKWVLSVQFYATSHAVHSYTHPRTSAIIAISKINSYAMVEWNAQHSSRVWMSCWVVWSWFRKVVGLPQKFRDTCNRFPPLQQHHFCVPFPNCLRRHSNAARRCGMLRRGFYHSGCLRTLSRSTEIICCSIIHRCERKKRLKCFAVVFSFIKRKRQHTHTHTHTHHVKITTRVRNNFTN